IMKVILETDRLLLREYADLGLKQIIGLVMPENIASLRVLEKIGLRFAETATFWVNQFSTYVIIEDSPFLVSRSRTSAIMAGMAHARHPSSPGPDSPPGHYQPPIQTSDSPPFPVRLLQVRGLRSLPARFIGLASATSIRHL